MSLHGKGANLSVGGTNIANLQTFSLTRVGETSEVTSMGDIWAAFIAGMTDFNGTAEGKSQVGLDTTALLGSGGATIFSQVDGGTGYSAAAIITGITETASIDSEITCSYTFEGNDAAGLVYGAATGTAPTASTNPIHGKNIDAEYSTANSFSDIIGWSITMTAAFADASVAHATENGKLKLVGILTATATVTVLTPSADLDVLEGVTAAQLNLWRKEATAAHGYYAGEAICTGHEQGFDVTGAETTTYSFVYTGTVDLVTA